MLRILPILCVAALLAAAPASAEVTFTNATSTAFPGMTLPGPTQSAFYLEGGAAGDWDGDGWTDLYLVRSGQSGGAIDLLLRNKGDGTFENANAQAGLGPSLPTHGAAWGDIDKDGDLDLYVTMLLRDRHLLYINGAGNLGNDAAARGVSMADGLGGLRYGNSPSFGDYDNDGYLDLFVTEFQHDDTNPTTGGPFGRLFRNRGAEAPGFFEDVTVAAGVVLDDVTGTQPGTFGFVARFTDLDRDGWADLAISADYAESRLFWNNRDGTFTDGTVAAGVGTDEHGMGCDTADYDGDGLLDWFVTSIHIPGVSNATGNRLYRNLGNRTFADEAPAAGVRDGYWGWGARFFDYDNDGDLDVAHTNGFNSAGSELLLLEFGEVDVDAHFANDPLRLWRNEGDGTFSDVAIDVGFVDTFMNPSLTRGLISFDYDEDGDLDLLVLPTGNRPVLYRNDGGNDNDWLKVEPRGVGSPTDGTGAVVEVTAVTDGPTQLQEISASSTDLAQDSGRIAHFGLGPGPGGPVHRVSVTWPRTGRTQRFFDVPRNSKLTVVELPEPEAGLLCIGAFGALAGVARLRRRRPTPACSSGAAAIWR